MSNEWNKVSIKNIAKEGRNNFIDGDWIESPYITDKGIRLIQTGNIGLGVFKDKNKKYISEASFNFLGCTEVFEGDILICRLAEPMGRSCIVPKLPTRAITSVDVSIFRVDEDRFSKEFIHQKINTEDFLRNAEELGGGSTRQRISRSNLGNIEIEYPPKPQQTKIAKILTTIDNVIEKTEEAIAKYEAIKQGMMHDLFTRGIGEDGQLRPSFEDAPELYKESALGWIPKEWEVKRLENLTQKIGDGIHATPKYVDASSYLFINGNNLKNGKIEFNENTKCVSEQEFKNHYVELNEFTILMSINGTIGNLAFYEGQNIVLGKSAAYIIPYDKIMSEFLFLYFQTKIVNHFFTNELTGSTIKNLSLASIRNLPTFVIQKNELEIIVLKLNTLDKKIKLEQEFLSKQTQLKKGLMQDLLTGKVSVTL